jgi:hypothetical protein
MQMQPMAVPCPGKNRGASWVRKTNEEHMLLMWQLDRLHRITTQRRTRRGFRTLSPSPGQLIYRMSKRIIYHRNIVPERFRSPPVLLPTQESMSATLVNVPVHAKNAATYPAVADVVLYL